MDKPWSDMTPRGQSVLTVVNVLGWSGSGEEMYWPNREWVWRDRSGLRVEYQGELVSDPAFARLAEQEIARRGLIERYQNALIAILGLDMQVFNSAIELHTFNAPKIPGNDFEWEGHAFLWCYSQATAEQRCHAAVRAMGVAV